MLYCTLLLPGTRPLLFIVGLYTHTHTQRERSHTHSLALAAVCFVQHIAPRGQCFAYFGAPNSFCGVNLIKDFVVAFYFDCFFSIALTLSLSFLLLFSPFLSLILAKLCVFVLIILIRATLDNAQLDNRIDSTIGWLGRPANESLQVSKGPQANCLSHSNCGSLQCKRRLRLPY